MKSPQDRLAATPGDRSARRVTIKIVAPAPTPASLRPIQWLSRQGRGAEETPDDHIMVPIARGAAFVLTEDGKPRSFDMPRSSASTPLRTTVIEAVLEAHQSDAIKLLCACGPAANSPQMDSLLIPFTQGRGCRVKVNGQLVISDSASALRPRA